MIVNLIAHTPNPDKVVGQAATLCYSQNFIEEDKEKFKRVVRNCVKSGHTSVLEHASFTFEIEGVSRSLTHQLVRHRIASYSQQSQRYVTNELTFISPSTIENNEEAYEVYRHALSTIADCYRDLIERGIKKEDARYILPNATTTKIVVTMNARALLNFFALRTSPAAQWEIRALANKMRNQCREVAPIIFGEETNETTSNNKND